MTIGDKVICVDTRPCFSRVTPSSGRLNPPLLLNQVYVVASTGVVKYGRIVNLIGVDPSPHIGFEPSRFRLLSEMKSEAKLRTVIENHK